MLIEIEATSKKTIATKKPFALNFFQRYPFVSCEVLTADVETLLEAFFGRNPNNLKRDSNVSELSS